MALAAFFRDAKDSGGREWKTAGDFFLPAAGGEPPCRAVRGYLTPVPAEVDIALHAVLPESAWPQIGLTGGSWVEQLCALLEQVRAELAHDVAMFEERRAEAFESRRSDLAARFERSIATLTRRSLIGYLANRNVLPKYGFPVDTVELRTAHCDSQVGARLELNRDLSVAIHEYAPGSELIAGGVLWRSAGIYRLPGRELITRSYTVCRGCQRSGKAAKTWNRPAPRAGGPPTARPASTACRSSASSLTRAPASPAMCRRSDPGTAPYTWCRSVRNSPRSAGRPGRARWRGATPARAAGSWRWPRVRAVPGS